MSVSHVQVRDSVSSLREISSYVILMPFYLYPSYLMSVCLCSPGGGSLRPAGSGDVSVEPAGPPSSLYVFLASAVCATDLLLLQHQRSAHLKREAPVPLSYQVRSSSVGVTLLDQLVY